MHTSVRCAECHSKMQEEWSGSAHARAHVSPTYKTMAAKAGDAACGQSCHSPLLAHGVTGPAALEGVTCDVCHTIREVDVEAAAGRRFRLQVGDMVRYGPLCDAEDHYFHRMACSPLHESAALCGACHQLSRTVDDVEVPVFTSYGEWKAGPYAGDKVCQDCHMPGSRAEAATGEGERPDVPEHAFLGKEGRLITEALALSVETAPAAGAIAVAVELENVGAGHHVPSGLPARRLLIQVVCGRRPPEARRLGRVLVDEAGKPAPFFRAVRVAADTRIPPRQSRELQFEVEPGSQEGELAVRVFWEALAPEVARAAGIDQVASELMIEARVPLERARARPTRVRVTP